MCEMYFFVFITTTYNNLLTISEGLKEHRNLGMFVHEEKKYNNTRFELK